jgi:hypothetical protein
MNRFTVEREGYGWIVCKDGEKVIGAVSAKWRADDQREKLERDARKKLRPCITCRKAFLSEGAHNRMCKSCRASAREIFDQAV